jgi:hypothetical protein
MSAASAVCDKAFARDEAAEACFRNKDECRKRSGLLTPAERQSLEMLQYPPALDIYGRQAFDYENVSTKVKHHKTQFM